MFEMSKDLAQELGASLLEASETLDIDTRLSQVCIEVVGDKLVVIDTERYTEPTKDTFAIIINDSC